MPTYMNKTTPSGKQFEYFVVKVHRPAPLQGVTTITIPPHTYMRMLRAVGCEKLLNRFLRSVSKLLRPLESRTWTSQVRECAEALLKDDNHREFVKQVIAMA